MMLRYFITCIAVVCLYANICYLRYTTANAITSGGSIWGWIHVLGIVISWICIITIAMRMTNDDEDEVYIVIFGTIIILISIFIIFPKHYVMSQYDNLPIVTIEPNEYLSNVNFNISDYTKLNLTTPLITCEELHSKMNCAKSDRLYVLSNHCNATQKVKFLLYTRGAFEMGKGPGIPIIWNINDVEKIIPNLLQLNPGITLYDHPIIIMYIEHYYEYSIGYSFAALFYYIFFIVEIAFIVVICICIVEQRSLKLKERAKYNIEKITGWMSKVKKLRDEEEIEIDV